MKKSGRRKEAISIQLRHKLGGSRKIDHAGHFVITRAARAGNAPPVCAVAAPAGAPQLLVEYQTCIVFSP